MLSLTIICLAVGVLAVIGSWVSASAMIVKATGPSSSTAPVQTTADRPLVTSTAAV